MMSERRISSGLRRMLAGLVLGGLLAAGCGGQTRDVTELGGESHFLRSCAGGCGDGLECLSGLCSRACDAPGTGCSDLVAAAECVAAGDGEALRCDLLCSVDDDCAPLAALSAASAPAHRCQSGSCRVPATAGPDASDDGIVPSGLAPAAGRCETDDDCGGAPGACGALPSGYRVCLDQTPAATGPSSNPTADQCDETRACPADSTCYPGLSYPSGACGLGGASQHNVCREDGCASDVNCADGFFCGPR
jgi:hypothetical protein